MSTFGTDQWTPILSRLNSVLMKSDEWKKRLTPEALSSRWCGLPPALESDILATEKRLGLTLPPSYRSFLSISNGWHPFGNFIERLLSVEQIDRFRLANPEAAREIPECYQEDELSDEEYLDYADDYHMVALRTSYYPDSILVGNPWGCESDIILLNPQIVSSDGEWEAIFFANWVPGNRRFRSFYDLVVDSVDTVERLEAS